MELHDEVVAELANLQKQLGIDPGHPSPLQPLSARLFSPQGCKCRARTPSVSFCRSPTPPFLSSCNPCSPPTPTLTWPFTTSRAPSSPTQAAATHFGCCRRGHCHRSCSLGNPPGLSTGSAHVNSHPDIGLHGSTTGCSRGKSKGSGRRCRGLAAASGL